MEHVAESLGTEYGVIFPDSGYTVPTTAWPIVMTDMANLFQVGDAEDFVEADRVHPNPTAITLMTGAASTPIGDRDRWARPTGMTCRFDRHPQSDRPS